MTDWSPFATGAAAIPGIVTVLLLIRDRGQKQHTSEALNEHDVKDLKEQLGVVASTYGKIESSLNEAAVERGQFRIRIESLERSHDRGNNRLEDVINHFTAFEAANNVAHEGVRKSVDHLERSVEGLNSQVRNLMLGSNNQQIEIRRTKP